MNEEVLPFDEWFFLNQIDMDIEFAETGADREMDFDYEKEINKKYKLYLNEIK